MFIDCVCGMVLPQNPSIIPPSNASTAQVSVPQLEFPAAAVTDFALASCAAASASSGHAWV